MAGAIIAVISALVTGFIVFRQNARGIQKDVIDAQERRIVQLDFDLKSLQASLSLQTAENAKLQGVVQTLEKVLENRDPKLQEVLIGILAFMQKIEKHMEAHDKKAVS
tara:strand:+ start:72 stop:395 length:324 start_codon:yes stop_codon:yes gene_type:complete